MPCPCPKVKFCDSKWIEIQQLPNISGQEYPTQTVIGPHLEKIAKNIATKIYLWISG
jgi:hypothetical protein